MGHGLGARLGLVGDSVGLEVEVEGDDVGVAVGAREVGDFEGGVGFLVVLVGLEDVGL